MRLSLFPRTGYRILLVLPLAVFLLNPSFSGRAQPSTRTSPTSPPASSRLSSSQSATVPVTPVVASDTMPPLTIGMWIGDSLPINPRPRYLLIDFWATWCPVCMRTLPHVNELAARYRDRGLAVLCMAVRDTEVRVRAAAEQTPFVAYAAMDRDDATWRAFGLTSIPAVYIADSTGRLRWRGHPSDLSEAFIEHLLQTDSIYIPSVQQRAQPLHLSITLTPPRDINDKTTSFGTGPTLHVRKNAVPPAGLVHTALAGMRVAPLDIEWVGAIPSLPLMDLTIDADSLTPRQRIHALTLAYVCAAFSLEHRTRIERVPMYSLSVIDTTLLAAHRLQGRSTTLPGRSNDGNNVTLTGISLDVLHHYLSDILAQRVSPVAPASGTRADGHRYTLRLNRTSAASIAHDLRTRYGIAMDLESRDVEIHIIDATRFTAPF